MRRIHASIDTFTGHGTHLHVRVRPEDDPAAERLMKFRNREAAQRWVYHVFHAEFDPEQDVLIWDEPAPTRWIYGEGD